MTEEEIKTRIRTRVAERDAYKTMTPAQKIIYLAEKLAGEIKKAGLDTSCDADRDFCIDCGLQAILNQARKIEPTESGPQTTG